MKVSGTNMKAIDAFMQVVNLNESIDTFMQKNGLYWWETIAANGSVRTPFWSFIFTNVGKYFF